MPRTRPEYLGGRNVAAFLDMLAHAEGTDNGRQPSNDDGYDVLVGGGLFTDYVDHPNRRIYLPKLKVHSTAAGRYQFLKSTWDEISGLLGLDNFFPKSQDAACVRLLRRIGAFDLIVSGQFDAALAKSRKTWASLPGAGYGQLEQRRELLRERYLAAGGEIVQGAP